MKQTSVRVAQRGLILALLRYFPFVPTSCLRDLSYQYNARIYELRRFGHNIKAIKNDGVCGFMLF